MCEQPDSRYCLPCGVGNGTINSIPEDIFLHTWKHRAKKLGHKQTGVGSTDFSICHSLACSEQNGLPVTTICNQRWKYRGWVSCYHWRTEPPRRPHQVHEHRQSRQQERLYNTNTPRYAQLCSNGRKTSAHAPEFHLFASYSKNSKVYINTAKFPVKLLTSKHFCFFHETAICLWY